MSDASQCQALCSRAVNGAGPRMQNSTSFAGPAGHRHLTCGGSSLGLGCCGLVCLSRCFVKHVIY